MIMKNRPICVIDGCSNLRMMKYRHKDGTHGYDKMCSTHHRRKYNMPICPDDKMGIIKSQLRKSGCEICGWDKAECDVHRVIYGCDGGEYVSDNVLTLCPNCHRLMHRGLLKNESLAG
jgi:hypothetical protein